MNSLQSTASHPIGASPAAGQPARDRPDGAAPGNQKADDSYTPQSAENAPATLPFPVVAIGASAGGLKAFETFVKAMPPDSGVAFVLIQHLAPQHQSELAALLQNHTDMAVDQIVDNMAVQPDRVYVIPPGKTLRIKGGVLQLAQPEQAHGHRAPIDLFFRSLAEDQAENAVCIVLSGTGTDGSLGLKAVKEAGGVTMAQLPDEADYDGMPRSAVQTGLVDVVAPIEELVARLLAYKDNSNRIQLPVEAEALPEDDSDTLSRIFAQLRSQTGHDFTNYKRSTVLRRLSRRMQVTGIETLAAYLGYLRQHSDETETLFRDFLISVTNFFRDPEAFEFLQKNVVQALFANKGARDQVRVWVIGCATGEEAYSVAMLLYEFAATLDHPPSIQIFATDIDTDAIAFARQGLYPDAIAADVSSTRLNRFFTEETNGFQVKKELRDTVLFATHNLITDPPFSRLDLITCRNVLIYLNRELQERTLQVWHYALRSDSYLFLGSSESADVTANLFKILDKRFRIFQRNQAPTTALRFPLLDGALSENKKTEKTSSGQSDRAEGLVGLYHSWLLKNHVPAALLVNSDYDIIYLFGRAGRYLQVQDGPASLNLLQAVVPELRLDLRTVLYQVFQDRQSRQTRWILTTIADRPMLTRLHVGPVAEETFPRDCIEVVFESVEQAAAAPPQDADQADIQLATQLEDELSRTKERLQTLVEEYETSNEELKASNEELQSMNEELQSTTEELETSKEELQSMNEELVTLNQELKNKIEELSRTNSDLLNLMAATDIGTIFLDRDLAVKRYTPRIHELFNLIPGDIGRPFDHISHKIDYDGLAADARQVLQSLISLRKEIRGKNGRWYIVRLMPYRTQEDKIDGVVLTFVDVDELKTTQVELAHREQQQQAVAELGLLALGHQSLAFLLDAACEQICHVLGVDFCKVLELLPDGEQLLLRAGRGWRAGLVGEALIPARDGSQAAYTLLVSGPVIAEDVKHETRFSSPALLTEHDISSGISVVIQGVNGPFGVLGAHSQPQRTFTDDDTHFIQAVANVLAQAINRQRAEDAIKLSEERFRNALRNTPVTVFNQDRQLRYIWIYNQPAGAWGGDDFLGKSDHELFPVAGEGQLLTAIKQQVLHSGQGTRHEVTLTVGRALRYYDLTVEPLRDGNEQIVGVTCSATDITEVKAAEQALRQSEELRQLALVGAQLGAWSYDSEHNQLTLDARCREIFGGYDSSSKAPAAVLGVVHPEDRRRVREQFVAALTAATEGPRRIEARTVWPDGSVHWFVSRWGLYQQTGQSTSPSRAAGIIMDITERKQAEANLHEFAAMLERRVEERTAELARSNEELDRFAYVASHDLMSPLRAIKQLSTWIIQDAGDSLPADSRAHLQKLQQRTERLEQLLRDLLLYSRAGRRRDKIVRVDMAELLRDMEYTLALPAGFTLEIAEEMPGFVTERTPLELILRNLVNNAVKHHDAPQQGHVWISAEVEAPWVTFTVRDDGPGIAPNFHERIFKMFSTLKPRDEVEGSGMGLALVKKLVETRGGSITVESALGQGATFRFTWPLNIADQ